MSADKYFQGLIRKVLDEGYKSEQSRTLFPSGAPALTHYLVNETFSYDLSQGEFPLLTLRKIPWKSAIKEVMWIYQDQSADLSVLRDKHNVVYWNEWDIGNGTIGQRYGATVKKYNIIDNLLKGLEENPFSRRHIINLWQYEDLEESEGLAPCAFLAMFEVRRLDEKLYLDLTLVQRSSDMLVALHINQLQYIALQMMVACHLGFEVGNFYHHVNNLHIYKNQISQAEKLLNRVPKKSEARLKLNAEPHTDFYSIKIEDFEVVDYKPNSKKIDFNIVI